MWSGSIKIIMGPPNCTVHQILLRLGIVSEIIIFIFYFLSNSVSVDSSGGRVWEFLA